jgi:ABC-2 type transport system ATP-binding protein
MIQVTNLFKQYGTVTAVDGISFDVAPGEIVALLGPNGAGKTTTIKILTTILRATSGTIEVDGIDVTADPHEVRRRLGVIFQEPSLDQEMTAYENLDFHAVLYGVPRRQRRERIERLLHTGELWSRRNDLVRKLSSGMRRRLEIARGLIHVPKVLILDEPTAGLDPQTRHHLWEHVQQLNRDEGITVLLTTHYLEEAERVADRLVVIDHGRIVARGCLEDVKAQTNSSTLDEAFVAMTGAAMRD